MNLSLTRNWTFKKLLLAILSVSALLGGIYASYWVGLQRGLQTSAYANAIHTRNYLAALQRLQLNQGAQAQYRLELGLAMGILALSPEGKFQSPRAESAVLDVLGQAKAYREKYPWSGYSSGIAEKVEQVLATVEAKPLTTNCQ